MTRKSTTHNTKKMFNYISTRTRNAILAAALIAATGSSVSADVFNWIGNDGDWSNSNLWFGPFGQVPDSILDSATISGQSNQVIVDFNLSIGSLNILNEAYVITGGRSLFVNGDTILDNSDMAIRESPALRDFDTDTLILRNGSVFVQSDGISQFDESLLIEGLSGFLGLGIIEMNSTTGDLVVESGVIWAQESFTDEDALVIQRTQSSNSELDLTSAASGLIVWDDKTMDIKIPLAGPIGGSISLSGGSDLLLMDPFVALPGSEMNFFGGYGTGNGASKIFSPTAIDHYGELNVSGFSEIVTSLLVLRGNGQARDSAVMKFDTTLTLFDSFTMVPNEDDGGSFEFGSGASTLSVINGETTIDTGVGGTFDLDGPSTMEVNIDEDASLILDVQFIERFSGNQFDSTLNIEGTLDVVEVIPDLTWINAGEINLDSGEIQGRRLINDGVISGTGHISAFVMNNGEIIADGGTLQFDGIDFDGTLVNEEGVIRAQTGDFVYSEQNPAQQFFSGSIYVGNGVGIREVFESNVDLSIVTSNMAEGLLDMNSGRLRANTINLYSQLIANGVSQINASGAEPGDRIQFNNTSTNTIAGTLELNGDVRIDSDASFQGEGTLEGVNSNDIMDLMNGVNLSDVSVETVGSVSVDDNDNGVGHVSVAGLTLGPSSALILDLAGSNNSVQQDLINVLDAVELNGLLQLGVIEGFSVETNQTYTIINANSVTGDFSGIDFSGLGEGYRATAVIHPDRVDVVVSCLVDLNGDGELDFFDISAFLLAHELNDEIADFNNDGEYDFFDISLFLSLYSMGCP